MDVPARRNAHRAWRAWLDFVCRAVGWWVGLACTIGVLVPAQAAAPLQLNASTTQVDIWNAATVLVDPGGTLSLGDARFRSGQFAPSTGQAGNLGRHGGAVWVRVPIKVAAEARGPWMLEVDYAPLDRADVYILDGERTVSHAVLGDHVDLSQRAWPVRSHAAVLDLPPGQERVLLMRVQSSGSLLVPALLGTPWAYAQVEAREQLLQGLLAGMALCMLVYTLAQWAALRDGMFGCYGLTLFGTLGFFAALSGVGPQHVWGASTWLTRNAPPFFILLAVCGAFLFALRALEVARFSPVAARLALACALVAGLTCLGLVMGLLSYGAAQAVGMALGPWAPILVLPTTWKRWRGGDRAAAYMMVGWGMYCAGVAVIVGLLAGALPVNFWTLHAFQFGSTLEMVLWMMVLAHRVQDLRRDAKRSRDESERMRSMAHSDALTGLLNRRGLESAVAPRLAACDPQQVMALFLLDLDGFKQVNDTRGHECGDELLRAVAQRLRQEARPDDLVCRLGGDEFVVCASGLAPGDVERVAGRLLAAFGDTFWAGDMAVQQAATMGYAVAPLQGRTLAALLKLADEALYRGKAAGKSQACAALSTEQRLDSP